MKQNLIETLKGICILAVLILHVPSLELGLLKPILQTAVPGFILIASINNFNSLERNPSIKEFYLRRANRLLPLFIIAWVTSFAIGVFLGLPMDFGLRQLVGYFPLSGPGNYFLPLLFQLVFLFPLLWLVYKKAGRLIAFFVVLTITTVFDILSFYHLFLPAPYFITPWLLLIFFGMLVAKWSIWQKNYKLPLINSLGRNSYPIYLAQIIGFRLLGGW